ncbi:MAG: dihydroorotase [Chloroflexi bacterium]|nr:dihydroorotase [Chloroflexota bacterium]
MNKSIFLNNGRIIDPSQKIDFEGSLLISNGKIQSLIPKNAVPKPLPNDCLMIDCEGMVICPGFIDIHTHLREPGFEHKETILTGAQAAAKGGFTTICSMPNTNPCPDNAPVVRDIIRIGDRTKIRILPIASITTNRAGNSIVEMSDLAQAGVIGFSDDGDALKRPDLLREALSYSTITELPIITHCEDPELVTGKGINEGWVSSRLGLPSSPSIAEEMMVARDIEMARITGGKLHLAHISTEGSVRLIRDAKKRKINITAEATPHHILLSEDWIMGWGDNEKKDLTGPNIFSQVTKNTYDTNSKVSPPLRSKQDNKAVLKAINDGTIDAIATDHAPHSYFDKATTWEDASVGISGLETAIGLLTTASKNQLITLETIISSLTTGPVKILGPKWKELESLKEDTVADITIININKKWLVDSNTFLSKGKNTPLNGMELEGKIAYTIRNGEIVYEDK